MRILLIICLGLLSLTGWAQTLDQKAIVFNGQTQDTLELRTEKTHTEYRVEQRQSTCSRQVFVGYQRQCRTQPRQVCGRNRFGQYICRTVYQRYCWDQPLYRTEYYTCYRTVRIPYQVFDYATDALVEILFDRLNGDLNPSGTLNVEMNELGQLSYAFKGAPQLLVSLKSRMTRSGDGDQRQVRAQANLSFKSTQQFFSPVLEGILGEEIEAGQLSFRIGRVEDPAHFMLKIKLTRFARTYFNGIVSPGQYHLENHPDHTRVIVNLAALNSKIREGRKYVFTVTPEVRVPSDVLNKEELPKKTTSKTFKLEVH